MKRSVRLQVAAALLAVGAMTLSSAGAAFAVSDDAPEQVSGPCIYPIGADAVEGSAESTNDTSAYTWGCYPCYPWLYTVDAVNGTDANASDAAAPDWYYPYWCYPCYPWVYDVAADSGEGMAATTADSSDTGATNESGATKTDWYYWYWCYPCYPWYTLDAVSDGSGSNATDSAAATDGANYWYYWCNPCYYPWPYATEGSEPSTDSPPADAGATSDDTGSSGASAGMIMCPAETEAVAGSAEAA